MQIGRTVKNILDGKGTEIYSVTPDNSVFTALELMAARQIGTVLVLGADGEIAGIMSERDYARKIALHDKTAKDTPVSEIMTKNVICVEPSQPIEEVMALMVGKRIRHLPVLETGELVGIISIGDVLNTLISEQKMLIEHLESYIRGY